MNGTDHVAESVLSVMKMTSTEAEPEIVNSIETMIEVNIEIRLLEERKKTQEEELTTIEHEVVVNLGRDQGRGQYHTEEIDPDRIPVVNQDLDLDLGLGLQCPQLGLMICSHQL